MTEQGTPIRWWPIALCALAVFLDGYDAQMFAMAVPLLSHEFNVPPTAFAAASSGSLAGMAVGALVLSPLADRYGRRLLLVASLLLFGLPTLLAMQAGGPVELAIWRVIAGCGLGATVPVTIAVCADLAPTRRRVAIVTLAASAFAIGASSAGLISPLLSAVWGWRGLFAYGGLVPLLIAALAIRGIPASRGAAPAGPGTVAAAAPGTSRVGMLFSERFRRRTLLLWALNAINLFANYGLASWLPTLLVQNGWKLAAASRVMSVLAIGGVSGSFFVSTFVDRGRLALGFAAAYFIAAVALAVCAMNPDGWWLWAGLLVLIGFGAIGPQLTLGPLASTLYPSESRSTGIGWANGFGRAGSLFGPLALAWLMNKKLPPTQVIGALLIPMLICLVCVLMLAAALRREDRPQFGT